MATANGTSVAQGADARVEADILAVAAEEREFAGLFDRAETKRRLAGWPMECAWLAATSWPENAPERSRDREGAVVSETGRSLRSRFGAGEQAHDVPLSGVSGLPVMGRPVRWLLVSDGPGAALAGRAAAQALSRCSVRCILSTGLCGALEESLKLGDTVHAVEVIDGQGRRWDTLDPDAGTKPVRLLSAGRVAVSVAEKRSLAAATGAAVVEMEAAGVAAEAARSGLPFYCLRVVSDGPKEELPMDFNRYRDSNGRFSRMRIAAACALRPWAVPALLRFDRQCRSSAGILGDCLVHARFA